MSKSVKLVLVSMVCVALGLAMSIAAVSDAFAQDGAVVSAAPAAPALPDPVADPIGAGSEIYKLYKSGGLVPAIIVGLFLVITFLHAKIKWLQSGYRALAVAGTLGALAVLVEPASRGTTPTLAMALAAIGTGLALAFNMSKLKPAQAG